MKKSSFLKTIAGTAVVMTLAIFLRSAAAEEVAILYVGDQETWLISAQGNLRDDSTQPISFYGGVDRLAAVVAAATANATSQGRMVLKLNAGDAFIPGARLSASFNNLATAAPDGGQDFYDTIAMRAIGFDATVFGNHEFDLGVGTAARFAEMSGGTYLSVNLDFTQHPGLDALAQANKIGTSKIFTTPGGKKIGVVGVTTPLLPVISSPATLALMDGYAGFSPANTELQNIQAMLPFIQAEIDDLRTNHSVDVVIMLSHMQNANNEMGVMLPGLRGIDLVVSGGGHELMAVPSDPLIAAGLAPTFTTHPIFANDADSNPVPVVTGHFGNRYLGEINATIDDLTGAFSIDSTRTIRVSGLPTDSDKVDGDQFIFDNAVQPVMDFLAALNAEVIGETAFRLNADRGAAGAPRAFAPGIRKSETNMGNLVADAIRLAGEADVAIQNGGGIRASIAGPVPPALFAPVTMGDTFNVLSFTNLVVRAPVVNAAQLKAILEHAYGGANTNPQGGEEGRFAQVSGFQVVFDSTRTAGQRVRRIVLTNNTPDPADDILLVDFGVVVNATHEFSLATIDFLANGGDAYPFLANSFVFENSPFSITYQEALANFIELPAADGGLAGKIVHPDYAPQEIFDNRGRIIDAMVGTAGNDTITGTSGADIIEGGPGEDILDGGPGRDIFVYRDADHGGDTIINFELGLDRIDVTALLSTVPGRSQIAKFRQSIRVRRSANGVNILFAPRGQAPKILATVTGPGVNPGRMRFASNYIY